MNVKDASAVQDPAIKVQPPVSKGRETLWTRDFTFIALINLLVNSGGQMLVATLPFFIAMLGGDSVTVGFASLAYSIMSLIARPSTGWLLDNKGRRLIFILGIIGVIIVPPLYVIFPLIPVVILLRAIQGWAHSTAGTASNTNAIDLMPASRVGEGIGYFGAATSLATMIGPAIGFAIWKNMGTAPLFLSISVMGAISLLLASKLHFTELPKKPATDQQRPLIWRILNLFDHRSIPAAVLMIACLSGGSVLSFIALFSEYSGLGSGGTYFIFQAMGTVAMRLTSGRLTDRHGEAPSVYLGCTCFAIGIVLIVAVQQTWLFYLGGFIFGCGFGLFCPAMQVMAVRIVPPERRGAAISTYLCSWDICLGLGGMLGGLLVKWVGYRPMFCILGLSIVASVLLYIFWGRHTASAHNVVMAAKRKEQLKTRQTTSAD